MGLSLPPDPSQYRLFQNGTLLPKTLQYCVRSNVVSSVRLLVESSIVYLTGLEVRVIYQYITLDAVYTVNRNPIQQSPETFRSQIRVTVTTKIQITI